MPEDFSVEIDGETFTSFKDALEKIRSVRNGIREENAREAAEEAAEEEAED